MKSIKILLWAAVLLVISINFAFPVTSSQDDLLSIRLDAISRISNELKSEGIIGFSLHESMIGKQLNSSNLCSVWKLHSFDNENTTLFCQGSALCCNFLDLETLYDKWDEEVYIYKGKYGTTSNSSISARIVYVDYSLDYNNLYSEVYYSDEVNMGLLFKRGKVYSNKLSDVHKANPQFNIHTNILKSNLPFLFDSNISVKIRLQLLNMVDAVVFNSNYIDRLFYSIIRELGFDPFLNDLGLFGLWHMKDDAHDLSGNGNDGVISESLPCFNDRCEFDGQNGHIDFDGHFNIAGDMTIEVWIRPGAAPAGAGRIVASTYDWDKNPNLERGWLLGDDYGSSDRFGFRIYDSSGRYAYALSRGFFAQNSNKLTHVVGVYKQGEYVRLYVNGLKVAEDVIEVPSHIAYRDGTNLRIGARADSSHQGNWDGTIYKAALYNRTMYEDEILKHYEFGKALF